MLIRPEIATDEAAISGVIERAFANEPHSGHTEQYIVQSLRAAGALVVSLVAEQGHTIVGHVAFSPVTVSDGAQRWYGLGRLAVEPGFQFKDVGAAMVRAGVAQLRALSAAGCVVLGNPAYYARFGFKAVPGLVLTGPSPDYFMAFAFAGPVPQGTVTYHAGFASEA